MNKQELLNSVSNKLERLHMLVTWKLGKRSKQMNETIEAAILLGEITQLLTFLSDVELKETNIRLEWLQTYFSEYDKYYPKTKE
ncbi:hypothetical protein [Staphylococcus hominis]|uniref:hypothetical protein n=1 Tax=Staphylococcus hominis TaxID=1290 RepID=UPI002DD62154|nr:hypothetical protein [Staphylococcus hominis]WRY66799.1 hypothetical protein P8632_05845 [Staphylococcus hominis]